MYLLPWPKRLAKKSLVNTIRVFSSQKMDTIDFLPHFLMKSKNHWESGSFQEQNWNYLKKNRYLPRYRQGILCF